MTVIRIAEPEWHDVVGDRLLNLIVITSSLVKFALLNLKGMTLLAFRLLHLIVTM